MAAAQSGANPMSSKTMMGMLFTMLIMMVVMMFRTQIGGALDVVFQFITFKDSSGVPMYPMLTLVIAGLIAFSLSNIVRTLLTDPVKMARNQHIQSEFNKEMRQARIENNLFKLKKLEEQQPKIMAMTMDTSMSQMKTMPITMLFVIPVYAWIYYFIDPSVGGYFTEDVIVNMPWGYLDLNDRLMGFIPVWIVMYTLISMPIGQIEARLIRWIMLKKRLEEIDNGTVEPA